MTETAEQKTKRELSGYLSDYVWQYQYSVFYNHHSSVQFALEDSRALRKRVGRVFKGVGILYCLRLKNVQKPVFRDLEAESGYVLAPYHTFYFSQPVCRQMVKRCVGEVEKDAKLLGRALTPGKLESSARVIRSQRLHNLNAYFGRPKINRLSRLNRDFWVLKPDSISR